MILVGSQRGGAGNLARHLLNDKENDYVTVQDLRGFTARDLHGALEEAHAVSLGTNCKQFLFSLSLNPPKDTNASLDDLTRAADQAEAKLGLIGQPRALVVHEKNGRRHAHVVWSRIDGQEMKAINMAFFKTRLNDLSKSLFLEHGWNLPDGHRENGWKNPLNFTLAEWQQAKRLDLDPRETKLVFRDAWERSDNLPSFKAALEDRGYFLARGDQRGFVATDIHGEVYSVSRMAGVKTKELQARLGSPNTLPSVNEAKADTHKRISARLRDHLKTVRTEQQAALQPIRQKRQQLVIRHRMERDMLLRGQERRWDTETKERSARLRTGIKGLLDIIIGRASAIKKRNEQEAYQGFLRDRAQREALFKSQSADTATLHKLYAALTARQRQERQTLAGKVGEMLRLTRKPEHTPEPHPSRSRQPSRGADFSL
ncbi:relaxase [Devosia sp. YIM 151766]|uniref:relaxase/mobilization nuclease domain-containing protein n=1 Tax=Devosia sp. YIM 151766 TaxID=3017325 RepID=UPI00255D0E70|nr:relaxase [Devosia sp. YIM 151766]WIY52055.1 relaxase [Devosia sp. YIM 151766]